MDWVDIQSHRLDAIIQEREKRLKQEGAMNNDGLLSCPFCGWSKIHLRKKTERRSSINGLRYQKSVDQYDMDTLGYIGADYYEADCLDYRFGVKFYCGRCHASFPYTYGEWHIATEDDVDDFDAMPQVSKLFDPEQESEAISKAKERWNRRS